MGAGVPVVVLVGTIHGTGLVDVVAQEGESLACLPAGLNLPAVAVQAVGVGQGVVPTQRLKDLTADKVEQKIKI